MTILSELNTAIPLELIRIIHKMLEKDAKDRYQNIDKLLSDLQGKPSRSKKTSWLFSDFKKRSKPRKMLLSPVLWMVIIFLFGLAGGMLLFSPFQSSYFSERDWMLMLDFENLSGEDIFHGTIKEALLIDLQQSQYVNIFPHENIVETLRLMQKKKDSIIDEKLGKEICMREDIRAMLTGSIGKLGNKYLLNVKIIDPSKSKVIWTEKVVADSKEKIYNAVDKLSKHIRRNLGESLLSIEKQDKPLEKVTTTSLQALRYYTIGKELSLKAEWSDAIPFFEKAIEVDSTFAMAYSSLGIIFHSMEEIKRALEYSSKSMKWVSKVSDKEKYYIEAEYYLYRSQFDKAKENYKILTRLYPDFFSGHSNLAFIYQFTRQYEKALESLKEAARIFPESWYVFQNLGLSYGGLSELDKSVIYFNKALEINPNQYWANLGLAMAYLAKEEIDKSFSQVNIVYEGGDQWKSIAGEWLASLYRYQGQYNDALIHLKNGIMIDQSITNKSGEAAKRFVVCKLHHAKGKKKAALLEIGKAVAVLPNELNLMKSGIEYAKIGMFNKAKEALQKLETSVSKSETRVNQALLYRLKGAFEFYQGRYDKAIKNFEKSKSLINNLATHAFLGKAYQKAGEHFNAIAEFEYIINHQWATIFDGFIDQWTITHFNLAYSYERSNKPTKAIYYYQKFLDLWQNADNDLKELEIARRNLAQLKE